MAVSYAPTKLRVPPGFQNLLEGLAREVLREQPDDILTFAAQYFKTQLAIREETGKDDAKKGSDLENLMQGLVDIDVNDPGVNEAATKIQASFRGHQVRQEIQQKKEEAQAATKIQASFRGHQTRKEMEKKKEDSPGTAPEETPGADKTADETADETAEKPATTAASEIDIDLEDPEVQKAAVKIQSSFRGHKAREEVKDLKSKTDLSEEQPAETQNQEKSETQNQEESETQKEEEVVDIDLEDPDVQKAAVTIQASFRGHKTREDIKKSKSSEDQTQEDKQGDIATEPSEEVTEEKLSEESPAEAQEQVEEKPSEETPTDTQEEVDIDLSDPDVAKAATKIQASFRGHKARKDMKDSEVSKAEDEGEGEGEEKKEDEQQEEAS